MDAILQEDIGEQLIGTEAHVLNTAAVDLCCERPYPTILIIDEPGHVGRVVVIDTAIGIDWCGGEIHMRWQSETLLLRQLIEIQPFSKHRAQ